MTQTQSAQQLVLSKFRNIKDFPKKGIIFKDITTVIKDKNAFRAVITYFADLYKDKNIDYIVGLESRGFIFGSALADRLNCGFVVIRKPGKLPAQTLSETYELEYGTDTLEIHADAIEKGKNVVIIDDLLATGGTARAACNLVSKLNANIIAVAFVLELAFLNGRNKLPNNIQINSMIID